MNQKGYIDIRDITSIGICLIFVFIVGGLFFWPFIGANIHYSSGNRIGTLVKFSERGLFIKNWCGEMNIGSLIGTETKSGTQYSPYVFNFGINRNNDNTRLIDQINSDLGKTVKLTYDQRAGSNPWLGCSDYIVTKIEVVK